MGQAFAPAVMVLRILSILPVLLSITHSAGLQWLLPLGRDSEVNRIIVCAGLVNVALVVILAPAFAHLGMAWAVVSAEMFVAVNLLRVTVRSMQVFSRPAGEDAALPPAYENVSS